MRINQLSFILGLLAASTVIPARLGAESTLPNNIVLPDGWPPALASPGDHPTLPPYIKNPPAVINISRGRQLFVDDFLISSTTCERKFYAPQLMEANPILRPDREWEKTGRRPSSNTYSDGVWFIPERGVFGMWYMCGYTVATCYAESKDGIQWTKPTKDVVAGTNIVLNEPRDSTTVWRDAATKNPKERYKLSLNGAVPIMEVRTSPDGIHWSPVVARSIENDDPRSTFYFDPFQNKWVFSVRGDWNGRRARRYRADADFKRAASWTEAPSWWIAASSSSVAEYPQLYNLDAVAYESLMLGMFSIFTGVIPGLPKQNEIHWAVSRDGFHWQRPTSRAFMAPSGKPDTWNAGNVQPAGGVCLVVKDKLYFYFGARQGIPGTNDHGVCSTGLATLRRDGFVSIGTRGSAEVVTKPVLFNGRRLFINADADGGSIKTELLDRNGKVIPGFSMNESIPVTKNATQIKLGWNSKKDLSAIAGKPVIFRFAINSAELFSFWVSENDDGASNGYVGAGGPGFSGATDDVKDSY